MEHRPECGQCGAALADDGPAYFCAHECTFCATCYRHLHGVCPNCSGELVRRPRKGPAGKPQRRPPSPDPHVQVRRAGPRDVPALAPLFDAYRQFYEMPPDPEASGRFLTERLEHHESVIFLAEEDGQAVGFMQLYPIFSSTSLGRVYILNDLFVPPSVRRKGVGGLLLETAREWSDRHGILYLVLETAVDNPAQNLYEAHGWRRDFEFLHYELPVRQPPDGGTSGAVVKVGGGGPDRSGSSPGPA